ncbi:hypothetical protein J2S30_005246 [Herbaspirillum rubrisubalbicans]|nr:hypothetical protein [Herbaspirillum rubrisubalbicans]
MTNPPASRAPCAAASITPPLPPQMMGTPVPANARAIRKALAFCSSVGLARTDDRHRLADRIGAGLPLCQLGQHLLCFLTKLIVDVLQLHHRFQ